MTRGGVKKENKMETDLNFDTALNIFSDASITMVNGHYTSCSGYISVYNNKIVESDHKVIYDSTNNYGEVYALLMAVEAAIRNFESIKYVSRINIFSDSQISIFGLRDWIFKWYKKLNKNNYMVSDRNIEIANQEIFNSIVCMIVNSSLPVHLYHQLGHKNFNSKKDIELVKRSFFKVNSIFITDTLAEKICYYNNFIDKFTRDNLLAVTTSRTFNLNNYQKDIIFMGQMLDDECMNKYAKLIYKE